MLAMHRTNDSVLILHIVSLLRKRVESPCGLDSFSGGDIVVRKPRSMPRTRCKLPCPHLSVGTRPDVNNEVTDSAGSVCSSSVVSFVLGVTVKLGSLP